jgi:acetyltransferase
MNHEDHFITFRSRAGHMIRVRPIQFEDTSLLVDIFENMSPESRYRRFHQTMNQVNPTRVRQEAANIAQADSNRNWGLIAFADLPDRRNAPIGAVRLVRTEKNEAEVAISIRDDFQNVGIGTQLMRNLADTAKQMGLQRLVADIQNDNAAIWHVFKSLPYPVMRLPQGSYSNIVISLTSLHEESD